MYLVVVSSMDSNTSLFFFDQHTDAIAKYASEQGHSDDIRLYCIFENMVERHYPTRGACEEVQFGKEELLA